MSSKYLIAIVATILLMAFLFSKDKNEKQNQNESEEEIYSAPLNNIKSSPLAAQSSAVSSDEKSASSAVAATENRQMSELISTQFSLHLKSMAKCLGLTGVQVYGEKTEPTIENLTSNLRLSLGDVVVQMDDWVQTEIIEQSSTKKRVRVDYDYPDGATPSRRLSMYQINSYGMPEIMSLTADEMNNPNEAYISSLIEGHEIVTEEKGARAYFPDGEELIFSVKNGHLQSLSVNKGERSFNCFDLDKENSSCTCP